MKRTWITKLFGTPARTFTRRFRPAVNPLEARETPANFYVNPPSAVPPTNGDPAVFDQNRPDQHNGTFGTDIFESLDAAVAAANASPGTDTIFLAHTGADFLYITSPANTPLTITDSVNIVGNGASASVLTTKNNQNGAVLLVSGAGVNVNLTDLSFFGGAQSFDNAGTVSAGGGQTDTAIRYTAGTTGTIDRTVWQGIFADGYLGTAIQATGANTSVTVQNSQFSTIGRVGVLADTGAAVNLYSNTYTGKGSTFAIDYFAQISSGSTAVISGNTVSGNQGVAGGVSAAVFVSQNGGAQATAQIFGNTFTGSIDGILVGDGNTDTSFVTASYNNIFGNLNGIGTNRDPQTPKIDATNVYWGTSTGPYNAANNPTGSGNDIADDVLFTPVRTTQVPVHPASTLTGYLAAAFPQSVTVAEVLNAAEPSTNGLFRFTRTGDPALPLTVNYTVGGTATAGADYTALSGTVTFAAGTTEVDVPVTVIDDTLVEGTETVVVTITASANYTVPAPGTATVTIADNDVGPPAVSVATITNAAEPATNGLLRFTRTGDTSTVLTVNYTVSGTATAGADYTALPGTVTFANGQTTVDVPVTVIDDTLVEGTETVVVTITASANYTAPAPGAATVTITDNDPAVTLVKEFAAGSDKGGGSAVLYNQDGTVRFSVQPFGTSFTGGVRVAVGDFNGDGVGDLVVGTGTGIATQVKVLNGVGGGELFSVAPFEAAFTGGVFVAAGDITGDGKADLVISPDEGGGPRVQVYSGNGFGKISDFLGINDSNFRGGARTTVGDVNGDGKADLVVAAGFGGGPRVSVYDGASIGVPKNLFNDIFVFEQDLRNGTFVAVGDVNGDGKGDLIAGGGPGGGPRVISLSGVDLLAGKGDQSARAINFFAGDPNARGGIRVAAKNLNNDANADLVVGDGTDAGSRVTGYSGAAFTGGGATPILNLTAFAGFTGGVFVG